MDNIIHNYKNDNTNLALSIEEYLEEQYPLEEYYDVENYYTLFFEREFEIFNFTDDVPEVDNPQLLYLYTYLYHIVESELANTFEKNTEKSKKMRLGDELSLISIYNSSQVNEILERLKAHSICTFSNVVNVNWVFMGTERVSESEKIKWIHYLIENKTINYQSIFFLIEKICNIRLEQKTLGKNFYNKINDSFMREDEKDFKIEDFSKALIRYKKKTQEQISNNKSLNFLNSLIY